MSTAILTVFRHLIRLVTGSARAIGSYVAQRFGPQRPPAEHPRHPRPADLLAGRVEQADYQADQERLALADASAHPLHVPPLPRR
ncbi:hypothetical protein OG372_02810 [Streptomyces sp. NBC_01020]|uniref:hypothetical protein n=1 Tax=unclassified Streptomyces TaxID=2593676 RepID=UPI003255FDB4|nr:hypothetical protein OG372_02810 [Streptomyces sp. NBC_01020]WSX71360.1 hypothetical protein OG221_34780 [Streptomyces sp. NBC_00932]